MGGFDFRTGHEPSKLKGSFHNDFSLDGEQSLIFPELLQVKMDGF